MIYCHPFVQCQSALPFWDKVISKFNHENPWSRLCVWSKVAVTFDLQNSKVNVMVTVKPIGHIWGLEFNRYVCFSCRAAIGAFLAEIWQILYIFDLEKSRSRSRRKSTKIWSGNLQARTNNRAKNERNPKSCSRVIAWTIICGRRRRTNRYKNIKSPPVYRGDLKSCSNCRFSRFTDREWASKKRFNSQLKLWAYLYREGWLMT